jgi:ribonuclease P protein component
MIGKNQRISKNQISWLLKKGQKANDDFFSIKFSLNKGPLNRYSVVISKKILNLATSRNQLRRQCYEILRQIPQPSDSLDFVIFIKSKALNLAFSELQSRLTQLIEKIITNIKNQNG